MRVGWLVVLAACGRIDFNPGSDAATVTGRCAAPVGHDEDGDGVDDACDGCPHIPDPEQIDTDGDGVDDICDPNPTIPTESIALFDPFTSLRPEWVLSGAMPTIVGDSAVIDALAGDAVMELEGAPAMDYFELGGAVGTAQVPSVKVEMYVKGTTQGYYYCELYDHGGATINFDLAYTLDGAAYGTGPIASLEAPLANGPFVLSLDHRPPKVVCGTRWPPGDDDQEPIPAVTEDRVGLHVVSDEVRLDYFIQIHTSQN